MSDPVPSSAAAGPAPAAAPAGEELLNVLITPNRSLTPQGFALVMAAVAGAGFTCGLAFAAAGAWPVLGFVGLEVALVYLAFRVNYRDGRATETVRLTREALVIRRADPRGRTEEVRLSPHWLRVELAGGPDEERLTLASHGRRVAVGAALSPSERRELAAALRDALAAARRAPGA